MINMDIINNNSWPYGGIGRHEALKMLFPFGSASSNLVRATNIIYNYSALIAQWIEQ